MNQAAGFPIIPRNDGIFILTKSFDDLNYDNFVFSAMSGSTEEHRAVVGRYKRGGATTDGHVHQ